VTAHGRDVSRDIVVPRLFVYDSFHEDFVNNPDVDLQAATKKLQLSPKSIVAFPPSDQERSLDLHVNVVVNDLTVAIFQELESKIKESDSLMTTKGASTPGQAIAARTGFFGRSSSGVSNNNGGATIGVDEDLPIGSKNLSIETLATVVSSNSELASPKKSSTSDANSSSQSGNPGSISMSSSVKAQLLTPLDEFWEYTELSPKDAHMMMKREVARRQKFTADLCLLAGSPLDAYERYTKAADLSKTTSPDPLWYASALEGCAAVHIAMADVGGFNVDEYLESSFQLPEELMSCALVPADKTTSESSIKKSMPQVVVALCEDALNVLSKHPKIACFHSELCLKLAWYTAEVEDVHVRCQWGLGGDDDDSGEEYCYGGDPNNEKRRWEMASVTRLNFLDLKNKDGDDVIQVNILKRCQKCSHYMHRAAASAALDPVTRTDVALRCLAISWKGIRPTVKPTIRERSTKRIQLKRKAAFFAVTAAEAMSDVHGAIPTERANAMWIQASQLLSETANDLVSGGYYGWATLRAVALHALAIQGTKESSEEAAKQLLMLMSEISPPNTPTGEQLSRAGSAEEQEGSSSGRSLSFAGARSYIRDGAKQVTSRSKELFANQSDMSSLVVAQSKWVDDDPLEPSFVPMGDFSSDFSLHVMGLPSVWTSIRFENCSVAQERLLQQIYELRKTIPASTLQNATHANNTSNIQKLPIEITSIGIVNPDTSLDLERVQPKQQKRTSDQSNDSMATFFNPYAKQEKKIKPKTVPRGEEQYISITFTNHLSIPFIVDSCKLEFDAPKSGRIKAPSISFTVPGQAKHFAVRFPFIVLEKLRDEAVDTLEVKGIFITALSRSIFLPVDSPDAEKTYSKKEKEESTIPKSISLYPRRDYFKTARLEDQKSSSIVSPRVDITPPQPKLRVSFASSSAPMDDESIIPVLLADGEIFVLPKICISNDTGLDGLGTIEELQISAIGLPGQSEVVLYDMSGNRKAEEAKNGPISISAICVGMDAETLNSSSSKINLMSSFLTTTLSASSSMGAQTKGCDMTLRFRYRGKPVSASLEVWRKYEVEVKILRVKGPRIPSLSFRCDLFWDSGYTDLCRSLASAGNGGAASYDFDSAIENKQEFVENRLGQDPGIHVCGDQVVIMVSVANESSSPIVLTRIDGSPFGFANSHMDSMKVSKGVSAKFPILLPRIERSENVCKELIDMVKFNWKSDIPGSQPDDAQETGGPMFPANCRVRQGVLELPSVCLKTIIDENPIFLSRICKAPCSIGVSISNASNTTPIHKADIGKPIDVSLAVEMAKWLSSDLKKRTKCVVSFCCAKHSGGKEHRALTETNETKNNGFVWMGQTRKNLQLEEITSTARLKAKIMFLAEGEYFVSACLTLTGAEETESGTKEVWWADKAAKMQVAKN